MTSLFALVYLNSDPRPRSGRSRIDLTLSVLFWAIFVTSAFGQNTVKVQPDDQIPVENRLSQLRDGMTVLFAPGTYFFSKPIELPPGLKSVTLEAGEGTGPVILSAGMQIHGWKAAKLNEHDCWAVEIPTKAFRNFKFHELWINGARATCARYPAKGYLSSVEPADNRTPWKQGATWFGFKPGDVPDELLAGVEAVIMNRWVESRLPIKSIDQASHRVNSNRSTVFQLQDGDPYFLENAPQWFEHPGDWYVDRPAGVLYYLPRAGETLETLSAIVPTRYRILDISHAVDLRLHGLTFSHSEWNLPDSKPGKAPEGGGFGQAEIGVPSAVSLQYCQGCRFESCTFEHVGNYALELGDGCRNNVISRCTFTDLGAGGIRIGNSAIHGDTDRTDNNTVSDCTVCDGGHLFPSAIGIWIGQSSGNKIEYNAIFDLYYTAISVGWTWGYGESLAHDNLIVHNLVHHIGRKSDGDGPILSDMGAVYLLGVRAGTVVSGNVFHDIAGRSYGGWGIYLDEGSSDVLVEKNLVYRTTHGGFHLHYGKNDRVLNNIFAFGRDVQIARTRPEPGQALIFKRNIVLWNSGVFTETNPTEMVFDDNLYSCKTIKPNYGGLSLKDWMGAGQDVHSLQGDPGFTNPEHGDFSFKTKLPLSIQFDAFDINDVGPRPRR